MASSSVSQEDVETDFQLMSRRTKIRTARARNPPAFPQRPCEEIEPDDREESPKPGCVGKPKERRGNRTDRTNYVNKGKLQRDRRKLREKRRSTGVVHLQSTESTGGSTAEDEDDHSLERDETKKNTLLNEGQSPEILKLDAKGGSGNRRYIGPSDLEADDEDTQDGDSLSHLKLDASLAELELKDETLTQASVGEVLTTAEALNQAHAKIKDISAQLAEAKREIALLKAERDFLREQNLTLRNQALAAKK